MTVQLLDDQLTAWEATARGLLAGLAERVTSRVLALHSTVDGASWLDISIVEAESKGDQRAKNTTTLEVALEVAVSAIETGEGQRLARWIDGIALNRLMFAPALAQLWQSVDGAIGPSLVVSNQEGTRAISIRRVLRCELKGWRMQSLGAVGLHVQHDATGATGHAVGATTAKLVAWESAGVLVGPIAGVVIYAGAELGDTIEIVDQSGVVVYTVPVTTIPTGRVTTPALAGGAPSDPVREYRARLGTAETSWTLQVTERP